MIVSGNGKEVKFFNSLSFRIPLYLMVVVFVVVTLFIALPSISSIQVRKENVLLDYENTAKAYASLYSLWIRDMFLVANNETIMHTEFGEYLLDRSVENTRIANESIDLIADLNPLFEDAYLLDMNGNMLLDGIQSTYKNTETVQWSGNPGWSDFVASGYKQAVYGTDVGDPRTGKRTVHLIVGMPDPDRPSTMVGALGLVINIDGFAPYLYAAGMPGADDAHAFLVDRQGIFVLDKYPEHIRNPIVHGSPFQQELQARLAQGGSGHFITPSPFTGRPTVVAYSVGPLSKWMTVMTADSGNLYSTENRAMMLIVGGVILAMVVGFVIINLVVKNIMHPVGVVQHHLTLLSEGDMTWEVDPLIASRKDEFGVIANAKKAILNQLGRTIGIVVSSTNQMTSIANEVVVYTKCIGVNMITCFGAFIFYLWYNILVLVDINRLLSVLYQFFYIELYYKNVVTENIW